MKKLISLICLILVVSFCFIGCSSEKQINKILLNQTNFTTENSNALDVSTDLFSNELKAEYSTFFDEYSISDLEDIIQLSNLTLSRTKDYLNQANIKKSIKNKTLNEIYNLNNKYYNNFSILINQINSLESVISNRGHNTKIDYEILNQNISNIIDSSTKSSKFMLKSIKDLCNFNFNKNQTSALVGSIEVLVLEALNNTTYYFNKICIDNTNFEKFINYGNMQTFSNASDNLSFNNISYLYNQINSFASSKFNLEATNFLDIREKLLTLQNYNNILNSKNKQLEQILKDFNYQEFISNLNIAYPNERITSELINRFANSDKISIESEINFKYLSNVVSNEIDPSISVLTDIINLINV